MITLFNDVDTNCSNASVMRPNPIVSSTKVNTRAGELRRRCRASPPVEQLQPHHHAGEDVEDEAERDRGPGQQRGHCAAWQGSSAGMLNRYGGADVSARHSASAWQATTEYTESAVRTVRLELCVVARGVVLRDVFDDRFAHAEVE